MVDHVLNLAPDERPRRHRYLITDGRTVDVITHSHDGGRQQAIKWARDTSGIVDKKELERIKIEGSALLEHVEPSA